MSTHSDGLRRQDLPARSAGLLLVVALVAGGVLRLWLVFHDDGIYWPDEVYQSLEPAHWLVYGYGLLPWEYVQGARNWTLAGFVAAWLEATRLFGFDHPRTYLLVVRVVFAAVSLGSAAAAYLLARTCGAGRLPSAAGATLCALLAPAIYFAPRAMSENAAALPLALGFALALCPQAGRWRIVAGASLVGLAVLFRLQTGVFALALPAILVARRRFGPALLALGALAVWAALYGFIDHLTWSDAPGARFGGWFHSAVMYVRFNLLEDRGSAWGTSPWHYYATTGFRSAPLSAGLGGVLAVVAARRATGLWLATALFVAAHSAIPHKELRFVLPAVPLLCALAGVGLGALPARRWRQAAAGALVVTALISGATFRTLTFGDLGQYPDRPEASAYDDTGPVNRLLLAAHGRPWLCGLRIDPYPLAWTGGYSYLHRRVPIFTRDEADLASGWVDHVIAEEGAGVPGAVVARDRGFVLVQLRVPGCTPSPRENWYLR